MLHVSVRARFLPHLVVLLAAAASMSPGCKCGQQSLRSQQPVLEVTPATLAVHPIPVGKTAVYVLQVRNSGNADLHFKSLPVAADTDNDGNPNELSLSSVLDHDCNGGKRDATSLLLGQGECARIVVQYAPANVDTDSGEVKFESDDPDHPVLHVPITMGDAAKLVLCAVDDQSKETCDAPSGAPPTVAFGHAAKGASLSRKLRIKNVGKSALDISAILNPDGPMRADFAADISGVPSKLQGGAAADVLVKFLPNGGGNRTAWIEVDSGDPLRPAVQVPLQGQGDGPALCADPSPTDFGTTDVGKLVEKTLTLSSCGTAAVQLKQVAFDQLSSVAFSSPALPGPQTLAPGASLPVTLRFRPDTAGAATGALLIPTVDTPDAYVLLRGTASDAPVCRLGASVTTVDFGQVVRGQHADRPLSLANRGKLDCVLSTMAITLGSSYFSVVDPLTAALTLRPGDSVSFTLRYSPPASDTNAQDTGTVEALSTDPVAPKLDVQLTGTAAAAPVCKLQISPASGGFPPIAGRALQFGNVTIGHTKVLPISFTNKGSANCTIQSYKLASLDTILGGCSNSNCKDYSIVAPFPTGPIAPGQTIQLNLQFKPSGINQVAFLPSVFADVKTSDSALPPECLFELPPQSSNGCVEIGLSGQGIVSSLQVLPSDVDFGLVTLGCKSKTENITLYNTGNGPFNIKSFHLDPANSPFFVVAPPTPFAMNPGTKVVIQVTYRPSQPAKETATLFIESDASNTTSNNPYITVALSGTGTTDKHQVDTFTQATVPTVDMLFVIDDSGSFDFYQKQIAGQAAAFVNTALKYGADFHIGVSANDPKTAKSDSSAAYPNVTIYPGGLYGQPEIVTSTTPNPADAFSKNIRMGTGSDASQEAGLDLAFRVLSAPANQSPVPQGSKGFLRDDARLVVIDVQDDDDESNSGTAFYVDFFKNLKGRFNAGLVSFNAIGSFDETTGKPKQCISGSSEPGGQRYYEVTQGTGGKTWSICNADWAAIANDLALGAFSGRKQFPLSRYCDPATLSVTMNGAAQKAGTDYVFDQPSNSVVFAQPPPAGATIVANYDALCF